MVELNVAEKLVLCILNKESSSRFIFLNVNYASSIGASVFMELFLEDAISLNNEKRVVIKNELSTDKNYLKDVYERIKNDKPKKLKKWIETYGTGFSIKPIKEILNSIIESLEKQGVLKVTKERGLFKEKVKYVVSEDVVTSIKNEIRSRFLKDEMLTKELISLTTLINQCELLREDLSRYERKTVKTKLKEIKKNDSVEGVKELQAVVDEIQAAMMGAVVASSIY